MSQVGNKNIDNASGQVVRLDMQNTLQTVATNNFGPRVDAGTILPCEFLADDTSNKLLIRKSSGGDQANPNPTTGTAADFFPVGNLDEDNLGLLPKEGGTMTGPLLGHDTTGADAPSFSFDGDSDTGMYRAAGNIIGFSTGGTERALISENGIDIKNGLALRLQDSDGSPFVEIKAPSTVSSSNKTITLPDETGTLLTSASSIANSNLANSSVTVGNTSISLGATVTTINGISTLVATNVQATDLNVTNILDPSGNNGSTTEQISKGRAKAWVNFDGTFGTSPFTEANGGIRDAFNVSSVTDNGQGDYTVTMATAMSTTTYVVNVTSGNSATEAVRGSGVCNSLTTTTFRVNSHFVGGLLNGLYTRDDPIVCCAVFGD